MRFPEEFLRRAEALADGDESWVPPVPRHAATVVLLREGVQGLEVFLMRRVSTMAFAAGMHVFPGGVVEPDDADVPCDAAAQAARLSADESLACSLVAAAARETFEECGVLLVHGGGEVTDRRVWEPRRVDLLEGRVTFSSMLIETELSVDVSALAAWDHWVTPAVETRRYDTRFFVARLPAGQDAHDLGGEADRVHWVRPVDAVDRYRSGDLPMLLPTADALESLLPFTTPDEVMAAAPSRRIRPRLPEVERGPDGELVWTVRDANTGEAIDSLEVGLGERGRPG